MANGSAATVAGGSQNTASGAYSFAAGRRAKAIHDGSFVWADAIDEDYSSSISNSFKVRAAGGAVIDADNTYVRLIGHEHQEAGNLRRCEYLAGQGRRSRLRRQPGTSPGIYAYSAGTYAGYFDGNIYVFGDCVGCTPTYVAVNSGGGALQIGDLVAADGVRPSSGLGWPARARCPSGRRGRNCRRRGRPRRPG